jgi:hypothetical protein
MCDYVDPETPLTYRHLQAAMREFVVEHGAAFDGKAAEFKSAPPT